MDYLYSYFFISNTTPSTIYNKTKQSRKSQISLTMTITEIRVRMDCPGCETKIKKALKKIKGVDDVETDVFMQKVTVMGLANPKKVLKTVRKTGNRAELWPYPYNPEYNNNNNQQYYHQNQNMSSEPNIMTFYHRAPRPSSSYNYYKHGYDDGRDYGSYQPPLYSTIIDEQASAAFSDDNPHACSIM